MRSLWALVSFALVGAVASSVGPIGMQPLSAQRAEYKQCIDTRSGVMGIAADSLDGVYVGGPFNLSRGGRRISLNLDPRLIRPWLASTRQQISDASQAPPPPLATVGNGALGVLPGTAAVAPWLLAARPHADSAVAGVPLTDHELQSFLNGLEEALEVATFVARGDRDDGVPGYLDTAQGDTRPERVSGPTLRYPPQLRRARTEGWAYVRFVIDERGSVVDGSVDVLCQTRPAFGRAASNTIRRTQYTHAVIRGDPTPVKLHQLVTFRIAR